MQSPAKPCCIAADNPDVILIQGFIIIALRDKAYAGSLMLLAALKNRFYFFRQIIFFLVLLPYFLWSAVNYDINAFQKIVHISGRLDAVISKILHAVHCKYLIIFSFCSFSLVIIAVRCHAY